MGDNSEVVVRNIHCLRGTADRVGDVAWELLLAMSSDTAVRYCVGLPSDSAQLLWQTSKRSRWGIE